MTDHRGEAERLIAAVQEIHTIEHIGVSSDAPMLATAHAVLALLDRIDESEAEAEAGFPGPMKPEDSQEIVSSQANRIDELETMLQQRRDLVTEQATRIAELERRCENQRIIIRRVNQLADELSSIPVHRPMAGRIRQATGLPVETPTDA